MTNSVPDIGDSFEYIIKEYEAFVDNLQLKIYISKIEKIIKFKIKTGYYLKLLIP